MNRRSFLQRSTVAALAAPFAGPFRNSLSAPLLKPPRLHPGATIGLVSPAGAVYERVDLEIVQETLTALGLQSKAAPHVLARRGYLAGSDADRAADLHTLVADPEVDALLALRGGWGAGRLLPLLDYDLFRQHPKILVGYSDITSLLIALYARSGLVTFHGPVGISTWNTFSVDYFRRVLFEGEAVQMQNPQDDSGLTVTRNRVQTITPGTATGRLVGGNLTVLTSILGSPYLPDWTGHILFLEDTGEDLYRIDRMLTHLKLAGVLDKLAGFVFGKCSDCDPGGGYGSLTLEELYDDHIAPLGIPAWHGAMIGHIADKFTVPLGVEVRIDATEGAIQMLEPAVS
ncbi:MAG TPA: LD-carboxypeptidase [Rhodothermales bacterium]|nr:LD-carboxypeptidase [Rhodothermales bacterium]